MNGSGSIASNFLHGQAPGRSGAVALSFGSGSGTPKTSFKSVMKQTLGLFGTEDVAGSESTAGQPEAPDRATASEQRNTLSCPTAEFPHRPSPPPPSPSSESATGSASVPLSSEDCSSRPFGNQTPSTFPEPLSSIVQAADFPQTCDIAGLEPVSAQNESAVAAAKAVHPFLSDTGPAAVLVPHERMDAAVSPNQAAVAATLSDSKLPDLPGASAPTLSHLSEGSSEALISDTDFRAAESSRQILPPSDHSSPPSLTANAPDLPLDQKNHPGQSGEPTPNPTDMAVIPEESTLPDEGQPSPAALRSELVSTTGTPDAQVNDRLKTAEKANQFAASDEQKMPPTEHDHLVTGAKWTWAESRKGFERPTREPDILEWGPQTVSWVSQDSTMLRGQGIHTLSALQQPGASASISEKILLQISQHTAELRDLKSDSMTVVLRPDAETEIYLRFRAKEGQIEVAARLDRGDSESLRSHWPQMQQALQQQGIRLGSLQDSGFQRQDSTPSFHHDTPQHQRQQPSEEQNGLSTFLEDMAASGSSRPSSTKRQTRAGGTNGPRGWETWA